MLKQKQNVLIYLITFRWFFAGFVLFYKKSVSPLLPHVCIYYPSCSSYMLESIRRHGAVKGVFFGTKRLLRCQPWSKGGFDPIPKRKRDYKFLY